MSLLDKIQNYKPNVVCVTLPTLGEEVFIRAMTASERDLFEQRFAQLKQVEPGVRENIRAFFIVHHVCNADGKLILDVSDVDIIGKLPANDADLLFKECQEISGFTDEDEEELIKK